MDRDDLEPGVRKRLEDILAQIEELPAEEQVERIQAFITCALEVMEPEQIQKMRAEFVARTGDAVPFMDAEFPEDTCSVLNLIDGHLALRELRPKRRRRK